MKRNSRIPAAIILALTGVVGSLYLWTTGAESRGVNASLEELEQAIACPDATTDTWLKYAQCLQQEGRFDPAVMAYQHVLATDPFSRTANLQCAAALAGLGDADRLHEFLTKLIHLDPRLALDIFSRPEIQPYLKQDRFQQAHKHAIVQSMD